MMSGSFQEDKTSFSNNNKAKRNLAKDKWMRPRQQHNNRNARQYLVVDSFYKKIVLYVWYV